jgi:gamma-tubulin complex component 5
VNLSKNITRTVEAFADAIDTEIRSFDMWCAEQEAAMCNTYTSNSKSPAVVVSLLHVSKALSNTFEHTFPVLFHILNEVFAPCLSSSSDFCLSYLTAGARAPAMVSSKLLDILFTSVQVHLERGETVTSGRLMRIFVKTAEPVWEMCGRWLRVGMGLVLSGGGRNVETDGLNEEFFIEEKIVRFVFGGEPFMGLLHPDFWREAYGLREGVVGVSDEDHEDEDPLVNKQQQKAVPTFLEHVAEMILQTGKAVGLIRALDSNVDVFDNSGWESFEEFIVARNVEGNESSAKKNLFSVSIDTLSRLIYDRLLPHCQEVGHALTKLLVDECGLWKHLEAIENLFLMRRGDAMSHFIDVVFNKVSSGYPNRNRPD